MENLSIPTLRVLYKHYVNWVSAHPERTTDLEASIKWISYFLAGRINNSTLLSELIYSMSNFMMLFNDQIILSTAKTNSVTVNDKEKKKIFSSENIKRFITTVDYVEVFVEISAKKLWGTKGRWIIIVLLQTVKCMARLYLLHVHKLHILESPPIQPLDRKSVGLNCNDAFNGVITLPSGRTIRKMDHAPPMNQRTWKAPPRADILGGGIPGRTLSDIHIVAETMYIMKPIVHLGSMCIFGEKSWKPWLISITIEYISLQRLKSLKNLSPQQRLVLSKRSLHLAMYIVRSPFFENYSEKHIRSFLHWFVNSVPLVGPLMRPFLEYMKQWQETYFYLWSV
ncbi:PREDICTED: peroxisomal membrane protein PEX16 [Diuraphis noxia]|uniref:peroxisomal membrane protein PEX16 n=1 Tax=Diuraphis noxia TaxID=143948 RepID=UPI000763B5F8|nr:PREDICTED: peroxisomal membrane protein PEX16 [Diuraphis noxia]